VKLVCVDGEEQFRAVLDLEPVRAAGHQLAWYDGTPSDADDWRRRLDGADGAMLMWGMPEGVLSSAPALRVVSFAYPIIPVLFIAVGLWMTFQGILQQPFIALAAALTIATGALFYRFRIYGRKI